MSDVKTADEIRLLHTLCEKAFAEESGYGEVHSLTDRGVYRTFRDGFFAANRVIGQTLRARVAELEAQVASGDYDYTVDEICNAYESGVGHRGRPTAHVNPYKPGSDLATAYAIGAVGDREAQIAEPAASRALDMLTSAALDHYTPHMVCVPSTAWSEAMRVANAAPAAAAAAAAQDVVRDGFTLVENKALSTARMALAHATTTHGELYRHAYESLLAASKGEKP